MYSSFKKITAYIYLILTFVIWGSLYVVSSFALGVLPTFTISWLRFFFAFFFLSFLTRKEKVKIAKKDYPYIFILGFVGYFIAVGMQLIGTKFAGSGMSSLLNSLNPVTMSVFGAIFYKEKLTVRKMAGILVSICGVYIILGGDAKGASMTGILFSLTAVVIWSFTSVFCKKVTGKYSPLSVTRLAVGVAMLSYFPLMSYEVVSRGFEPVRNLFTDFPCLLAIIYMGCVCTGVAYVFWNRSLLALEASTCSSFYPVQPLISTVLGVICFHEVVTRNFVYGSLLIIAGVLLNVLKGKEKEHTREKKE